MMKKMKHYKEEAWNMDRKKEDNNSYQIIKS